MSAAPLSIADILDRAADLIEPEGAWSSFSGYCAVAAITKCSPDCGFAARRFFRSFLDVDYIHEWNDAPGRTQSEVVAKLREAAELARSQVSL